MQLHTPPIVCKRKITKTSFPRLLKVLRCLSQDRMEGVCLAGGAPRSARPFLVSFSPSQRKKERKRKKMKRKASNRKIKRQRITKDDMKEEPAAICGTSKTDEKVADLKEAMNQALEEDQNSLMATELQEVPALVWPDLQEQELPYLFAERIREEKWEQALADVDRKGDEKTASLFRRFARLQANGDVLIIDAPTGAHETASRNLVALIKEAENAVGVPRIQALTSRGSMTCYTGGVSKEADDSLVPRDKPNPGAGNAGAADRQGLAFPNLVVEVGVSEGLSDLKRDVRTWLSHATTVQIVVIIYISRFRNGNTRMLAQVFTRANPPPNPLQSVEFGTAGRTANARPPNLTAPGQMFLHLPLNLLYHGSPAGVPAQWQGNNLSVDLFYLREDILRAM